MIGLASSQRQVARIVCSCYVRAVVISVRLDTMRAPRTETGKPGFFHETMNFMNFTYAFVRDEFCETGAFCDENGGARRSVPVG
jgi:hypothetical protein